MKRVFTEEHKQKLSEAHKGKIPSNLEQLRLYRKGRPLSEEHKKKIADTQIGKFISEETRIKISLAGKGRIPKNKGTSFKDFVCLVCNNTFKAKNASKRKFCSVKCYRLNSSGEKHYRWIEDRDKLAGKHKRNQQDPDIKRWRKNIFIRDNFTCKLKNKECEGRIEGHHILRWRDYKEKRYEISNGITLCHKHHPRTRKAEDEMVQILQSLIA